MVTIAPASYGRQDERELAQSGPQPSAYGGVLLLAQAWAILGGSKRLTKGLHWQGKGGFLLFFVLVVWPVLWAGSVRGVALACSKVTDPLIAGLCWGGIITQRRLARFVASPRHDWMEVLGSMVCALIHHPAMRLGAQAIIIVDSTTAEKRYGPKLPGIRPVYDATKKKLVDGFEIVSVCVTWGKKIIPVGLVPHQKASTAPEREALKRRRRKAEEGELPSKLDVALGLVSIAVAAGVGATTVVGDSAFNVMWWLKEVTDLGLEWLVATRQDRRLRIGAVIRAYRDWAKEWPLTLIETDQRGNSLYGVLLPQATMLERHSQSKGFSCHPAYFERRNRRGKVIHSWYLVTSQLDWSLGTIWLNWSWRWRIEQLHRDSKQWMMLSDFHVRTWEGIVALIACTSLRASLLYFMQALDPVCTSLSIEKLVPALRLAACCVEDKRIVKQVNIPPTLPATDLWNQTRPPLPATCWPIVLKAA